MTKKSFYNTKNTSHNYWRDKYIICSELLLFTPGPFSYVGFNFGYPLIGWISSLIILCGAILLTVRWYRLYKGKSLLDTNTSYLAGVFALLLFAYTTALIGLICISYNEGINLSASHHTVEVTYWFRLTILLLVTDSIAMIIYYNKLSVAPCK